MRRLVETLVFTSAALATHILIFMQPATGGAQSSGQGGEALVSLTGATAQTRQMVEDWDRPPETTPAVLEVVQPPEPDRRDLPQVPTLDPTEAPMVLPSMAAPPPPVDVPSVQTQAAPPPPTAAPPDAIRPQTRPDRASTNAQPAQAEQKAAGSGGGTRFGLSGASTGSTLAPARAAELQAIWGAGIRAQIERRKRFPSGGRGSGQVVVTLTISRTGQLLGHGIQQSSGNAAFDQAALQAVARAGQFDAAPAELAQSSYRFALPISFSR